MQLGIRVCILGIRVVYIVIGIKGFQMQKGIRTLPNASVN